MHACWSHACCIDVCFVGSWKPPLPWRRAASEKRERNVGCKLVPASFSSPYQSLPRIVFQCSLLNCSPPAALPAAATGHSPLRPSITTRPGFAPRRLTRTTSPPTSTDAENSQSRRPSDRKILSRFALPPKRKCTSSTTLDFPAPLRDCLSVAPSLLSASRTLSPGLKRSVLNDSRSLSSQCIMASSVVEHRDPNRLHQSHTANPRSARTIDNRWPCVPTPTSLPSRVPPTIEIPSLASPSSRAPHHLFPRALDPVQYA